MAEDFNPASVEITKATLLTYDKNKKAELDKNQIGSFEITQSMSSVAYAGHISVMDSVNILDGFPIRGEEFLELWIKCNDLGTEVKLKTRIHKVTDISPSQHQNTVTYNLHFVSETTFNAITRSVTAPYSMSISGMAKEIFNSYFSPLSKESDNTDPKTNRPMPIETSKRELLSGEYGRYFYLQPTNGQQRLIIPSLLPGEAMNFIAARGYNASAPSQSYRFFETLENYYFATDEFFIKRTDKDDTVDLFYAPVIDYVPSKSEEQIQRIEQLLVVSKGIDSSTDILSGSYRSEVIEIDLVRRRVDRNKFNFDDAQYVNMDGEVKKLSENPHTEQFRKDTFTEENAKSFLVFRNYTRPGDQTGSNILHPDRQLSAIAQNRVSYYHHLNNTSVAAVMKGRLDIRPGQIVNLTIGQLKGTDMNANLNTTLSGKYLIQSTNHKSDSNGTLNTSIKMAKFDWSLGTSGIENVEVYDTGGSTVV